MFPLMALLVGVLFACGVYLLLCRSLVRMIFGIVVVGHAVNLAIFASGGLVRATAPLVPPGGSTPPEGAADPVPQALVLTAIVIGFALTAFAATLVRQVVASSGTGDADELQDERGGKAS
ncbi:MAG: NADH-quinone oxidoreductase subunit K [Planctomycetota bacterium]